ncbi:MAG: hypothetical protein AB1649_22070 [Chloroflexota bacterium]
MPRSSNQVNIYLEIGQKRVFAGAVDWPGWCRNGRDEASALPALYEAGPRYARVLRSTKLGFHAVKDAADFAIVERIKGNTTTDFGAPDAVPTADSKPMNEAELKRSQSILKACWRAFEAVIQEATGQKLRTGPRGGGRDLEGVTSHVLGSHASYLSSLGWKLDLDETLSFADALKQIQQGTLNGLKASAHGEIPARGPRGGVRWAPRYFVRRAAWHILDHVWEIEDRLQT